MASRETDDLRRAISNYSSNSDPKLRDVLIALERATAAYDDRLAKIERKVDDVERQAIRR